MPQQVLDALEPYIARFADAPPVYSLLADEHGGIVRRNQPGSGELGVGQPCVVQDADGKVHCAPDLAMPDELLDRLRDWGAAMRQLPTLDPGASQHTALFKAGELLASHLAWVLGADAAQVQYFPYLVTPADLQRWFFLVGAAGVCHKVTVEHMLRAHYLAQCLDPLLPSSVMQLAEDAVERRLFDIVVPRITEDAMVAKWLDTHDYGLYVTHDQRQHLVRIVGKAPHRERPFAGLVDYKLAAAQAEIRHPRYRQFVRAEIDEIARRAAPYYKEQLASTPHFLGQSDSFWQRFVCSRILASYKLVREREGFCIPDAVVADESRLPGSSSATASE